MKKLHKHGLKLEPKKSQFFCPKVNYLGNIEFADHVTTDPDKTEVAKNWPRLRALKDLRSFLGFASYYCGFVLPFAQAAKPLHELVSKMYEGGKHVRQTNKPVETIGTKNAKQASSKC